MLSRTVEHYLEMRRATGFRMRVAGYLLRSFTRFAAKRRESHVCTRTAIEWASLAPSERQRANRLGTLRMFARFARAEDPRHEVPPPRVFAAPRVRYAPFILSQEQVVELIRRAAQLKTDHWPLRQWTFCTLFSLLAVTGMRISEALALAWIPTRVFRPDISRHGAPVFANDRVRIAHQLSLVRPAVSPAT
jgi:integrase/recombinase XerD